tara:strand:+ start:499 stop:690 length:192 start_codon:yes stop_codon:yes gene_type:complete
MRTSLLVSISLLTFMGCQQLAERDFLGEPVWLPLQFEWVEPLDFQHRLLICREAPTCDAASLF